MNTTDYDAKTPLELDCLDRWNAYNRLRELSIPCECTCGHPLRVEIASPVAALQVWSVVRQLTLSRQAAIEALENCWKQAAKS